MTTPVSRLAAGLALGAFATGALAHAPAASGSVAAGFSHPLGGLDHLLAMLAVGMWAGRLAPRAAWTVALTFIGAIGAGFGLAALGIAVPVAELGVAGSLLIFGLLVAFPELIALRTAAPVLALLGAAHGHVHGLESTAAQAPFLAGLLVASTVLVGIGMLLARHSPLARAQAASASQAA